MKVIIIDYGMGNLGSVKRAFEECGGQVEISEEPRDLRQATHIVLPGVGAFTDGMGNLKERGWIKPIRETVDEGIPLLGICLGMQLLAESGIEGGETEGLGLIRGKVDRLIPLDPNERIPHVGWNEMHLTMKDDLFGNIPDGSDFYFVHSYHFVASDPESIIATTPYCGHFASVVKNGKVFGTQFHPEKSQRIGFQLIRNFLCIQ